MAWHSGNTMLLFSTWMGDCLQ